MSFFLKIKKRIAIAIAGFKTWRENDRIDRADVLLAHRIVARRRLPSPRQWHLVGRVLKPGETRILRVSGYILIIGVLFLISRWAITHAVFIPAPGGEYREGIVGSPRSINPIIAGGSDVDQDIVRLVFSGLYRRNADAELELDLAQKVEISSNGEIHTFTLKPDAVFHDGKPVTAADVVFTINSILDPNWKSPLAKNLHDVSAVATDDRTVVITAKKQAYLTSLLTFGILPKHIWENVKPNTLAAVEINLKPIGSGPFKFEKFSRDAQGQILSYTLQSTKNSGAMLDNVTFKFYDDYDTAVDKLTTNAVDGLNFVPPAKRDSIRSVPGVSIRTPALSQYTALFLNAKKNPALADINIRKALALAIDRDKIVTDALGGLGKLRDTPLKLTADETNEKITRYTYDPKKAAELLDKAGYPLSSESQIRTKTVVTPPKTKKDQAVTIVNELTVTIATIDTTTNHRVAEIIKENWAALGIKTDIVTASADSIQKSIIKPREYDALLFGEVLGPDANPYPFWHSSQSAEGLNLTHYSNRRADELLEKSQAAVNTYERDTMLSEFQQIVTDEVPAIFLYEPDYLYPQSSKIKNFNVQLMTTPADRFSNIKDWYRKLKLSFN